MITNTCTVRIDTHWYTRVSILSSKLEIHVPVSNTISLRNIIENARKVWLSRIENNKSYDKPAHPRSHMRAFSIRQRQRILNWLCAQLYEYLLPNTGTL